MNENVALSFGQIAWLKLRRPVSAVRFDSNAVKLTTAKYFMSLTKFCELLACQCMSLCSYRELNIITHSAGQTYVLHGCKWNFAGPQMYLQPAETKSQHFGVSLKFLVCN